MPVVSTYEPGASLELGTTASLLNLFAQVWPPADGTPASDPELVRQNWRDSGSASFIIEEDEVLAHARIFPRTITTVSGTLLVAALAGVCVHPEFRGRGWGAAVVTEAFQFLPQFGAEVSLFQTGVPDFYRKLGCTLVSNEFVQGADAGSPFWDPHVMIYPSAFEWPDGRIDLNGPGF